jgi:ribosome-associated translation inhibitor RaiA
MGQRGKSLKRAPFAVAIPRPRKRAGGRAAASRTPVALRTTAGLAVAHDVQDYIRGRLGFRLGKFARHIERITVRFSDVNGPRGGVDTVCGIKVVLSGLPSVVVAEAAHTPVEAFNRADDRVERAVRRSIGRAQGRGLVPSGAPEGGRAIGAAHGAEPEVRPRAAAPRNVRGRTRRATAALEGSAGPRPSRKSTRGSVNRAKQGNKLRRRQSRRVSSPKARATRSRASGRSSTK